MSRSVFFPITKEARDALYGQILHSYELTMEKEMGQRQEASDFFLGDEDAPPEPEITADDDLPFGFEQSM